MSSFSRRSVLLSAAIMPAAIVPQPTQMAGPDAILAMLGRQFDTLAAKLDSDWHVPSETLEEFNRIEAKIIATRATTIEGLCVKARVTCWALLGDLDPNEQSTANERMALSIVRDLIRLCDPSLERPGALKRLVNEIEQAAEARRQNHG